MNDKPGMTIPRKHLAFACLVGLLLWAVILAPAWASGDDLTNVSKNENTLNGGDLVGGDTNIAGDQGGNAWGFSHSLGDVDINEGANCMGSEAWGSIIVSRQTNELNQWCAGLFYDLNGKHRMAAIMRCDIKQIAQHFDTVEACVDENTIDPGPGPVPVELSNLYDQAALFDEHQDTEEQHDIDLARTIARQDELEARLDDEAAARRRAVKVGMDLRQQKRADDYDFAMQQQEIFQQIIEPATKEGNE